MKTNSRPGCSGFTLIELMAVITIIVILAGLVVGGLGFVNDRQAKEKAKVQIALLSKGLEAYKLDMGSYPNTDNTPLGLTKSATSLYIPLFYEGYDYAKKTAPNGTPPGNWTKKVGTVDFPKSTTIYLPDLDPTSSKQGWVNPVTGNNPTPPVTTQVKDPWGTEYRYRTSTDISSNPPTANTNTINPDFDLWSSGKDAGTAPASATDAKNRDDIKNF